MSLPITGSLHGTACNEYKIPSVGNFWEEIIQHGSNNPFRPISMHGITCHSSGDNCEPAMIDIIRHSNQHNERVRIRLAEAPHPLEIG